MTQMKPTNGRRPSSTRDHLLTTAVLAALAVPVPAQLQFEELGQRLPPDTTDSIAMGDVDGDGDLDIICAQAQQGQERLYLNDGHGNYADVTTAQMPSGAPYWAWAREMKLADIDGDQDLDLVLAVLGHNRLYLNDGTGVFSDASANLPAPYVVSMSLAVGDIDADGDLDLVFGNEGYGYPLQNRLYANDGTGSFVDVTSAQMPIDSDMTRGMALGDVDGDGDLDLVCANLDDGFSPTAAQNRLYLNDGAGVFADATSMLPTRVDRSNAVAFGDIDDDGDLDLLFGNECSCNYYPFSPAANTLYLNGGSGTFTDATNTHLPLDSDHTTAVTFADIDSDGDIDIVSTNLIANGALYINSGAGSFIDATSTRAAIAPAWRAAIGDIDGDGDLDIAAAGLGPNRLYLNLQRQLDAPSAPQIGQPYSLDAYLRHGPASTIDLAAVYLSTAPTSVASPFGTLGIDPSMAVPFPTLIIPQLAGVGSVGFTIPNMPGLIGQEIYSQAILIAYPVNLRLSNVVRDVIEP